MNYRRSLTVWFIATGALGLLGVLLAVLMPEGEMGSGIAATVLCPIGFLLLVWFVPVRGLWPPICGLSAYLAIAIATLRFDPPWGVPFLISVFGLILGLVLYLAAVWRTRRLDASQFRYEKSRVSWYAAFALVPLATALALFFSSPSKMDSLDEGIADNTGRASDFPSGSYETFPAVEQRSGPPLPPVKAAMPLELTAQLPKTDDGLPILVSTTYADKTVALVFDESLDDPITRWGECLSRVLSCRQVNTGPIAPCIDMIEHCATNEGGIGCCPSACIAEFKQQVSAGEEEFAAIENSFLAGNCVEGLADFTNEAMDGLSLATRQANQREVNDPLGFPIPNTRVLSLKFYSSGSEIIPFERRQYQDQFAVSSTRYINWELLLEHPNQPGLSLKFAVEANWHTPQGTELASQILQTYVEPGWLTSRHNYGWGWTDPGNWQPGAYKVEIMIQGEHVAEGSFEVVAPGPDSVK